jgi:hypothetical protein
LRARFADIMAGIARRVPDPERRELLRTEAARLNPDSWVTVEEVRLALEQYETVFESLRGAVAGGRRRRRRRSGGRVSEPPRAGGSPGQSGQTAPDPGGEDGPEEDGDDGAETGSSQN